MQEDKTLAIPLRKIDFSETSQVLRFLTRDFGKITAIARGAKRQKGSFQGPFDLFIEYEIVRLPKQGEGHLDVLTAGAVRQSFPVLREKLEALYAASYAAELVDELTPEAQPAPSVYELFVRLLEGLQSGAPIALTLFQFEGRLLKERGYFPRLLECGGCRSRISQTGAWFSPRDGGAVCLKCGTRDPAAMRAATRTLYAAANLTREGEPLPAGHYESLADELRRLLDAHVRHVTDRALKSARFAWEVCVPTRRPPRSPASPPRQAPRRPRAPGSPSSRGS